MKIVVCIKQVPDTTEIKLDPVTGTMIRDGVPSIMNPDDKGGLEMALALKDKYGAQVTVITMGPPQADDILREAFAMGADRAIHLSDRMSRIWNSMVTSCLRSVNLPKKDIKPYRWNLPVSLLFWLRQTKRAICLCGES